jgi:plasmid stability protein
MKNVTIAIDDETHRRARIRAAELGTSLSALVKDYLNSLADGDAMEQGLREMPMPFHHAPSATAADPTLPPGAYGRFPDGTPYYTKDGKPRKPGGLKGKMWMADDFDEWPEDILATFEAWPYDDPDYDFLKFSPDQLPKE